MLALRISLFFVLAKSRRIRAFACSKSESHVWRAVHAVVGRLGHQRRLVRRGVLNWQRNKAMVLDMMSTFAFRYSSPSLLLMAGPLKLMSAG